MTLKAAIAGVALLALPASAQDFAFTQSCELTLEACDMMRDGGEACPVGTQIAVDFWAEGDAFYIKTSKGAGTGFGAETATHSLGQGYLDENLRVYYLLGQPETDGVFWISVRDGSAGAQLNWAGQEDYFRGACTPRE